MRTMIITGLVTAAIVFGMQGCAEHQMLAGTSKAKSDVKFMNEQKPMIGNEYEKRVHEKFIRIEMPTKASEALKKLGKLNGKIYIYQDDIDPILTPSAFKIKNFRDLDRYLSMTTPYRLELEQNRYYKGMPKIVSLKNKDDKFDLLKHKFVINGRMPLYKAFSLLGHQVGYSVVYNYQDFSTISQGGDMSGGTTGSAAGAGSTQGAVGTGMGGTGGSDFFSKRYIDYSGKSVEQFVGYIEKSFNLYVTFNHQDKLINIQKYRQKMYILNVNDVQAQASVSQNSITASATTVGSGDGGGSVSGGTTSGDATGGSTGGSATTGSSGDTGGGSSGGAGGGSQSGSMELANTSLFGEVESDVKKIIEQDASTNPKAYYSVNKTMGIFTVKASPDAMAQLDRLFEYYNAELDRNIKVTIDIYDVAIKNQQGLSTALNYSYLKGDTAFNIAQKAASNPTNSLMELYTTNGANTVQAFLDTATTIGRVVDHISYSTLLKNYIPEVTTRVDVTNYIQTVRTDYVTSNNNIVPVRTPQVGQYQEGNNIFMLAKIVNGRIHLKFSPVFSKLQSLEKSKIDDTEVTLPTINYTNPVKDITLADHESRIALATVRFNRTHDYEGVLPLDDFAIMGDTAHGMIRTETVFIVKAEIEN